MIPLICLTNFLQFCNSWKDRSGPFGSCRLNLLSACKAEKRGSSLLRQAMTTQQMPKQAVPDILIAR